MSMEDWPDCIVSGCPRKCCLALNSEKCFPHTKGNEHVKRWKIEARNGIAQAETQDMQDMQDA